MKLTQISISNFKCFDSISIKNLKEINVFIGKNNTGKSSILEALDIFRKRDDIPKEFWKFGKNIAPTIDVIYELSSEETKTSIESLPYDKDNGFNEFVSLLKKLSGETIKLREIFNLSKSSQQINYFEFCLNKESDRTFRLSKMKSRYSSESTISQVISELNSLDFFVKKIFKIPDFLKCDSFRRIESLFSQLFRDKNSRDRTRNLLFEETQEIIKRISPDKLYYNIHDVIKGKNETKEILFTTNEKDAERIGLFNGGAGNVELIYLVYKIITGRGNIIGIEEPEIHFHPELQKRFISFLKSECEQYESTFLITTHSNIFINENLDGSSYLVRQISDKNSSCEYINQDEIMNTLEEIGLTFSDFYLTNGLLFVEGKSDKEAIKKWTKTLKEYDFEHLGIKIVKMEGARKASSFVESKVLKHLSLLPTKSPFLILLDKDEKSQNETNNLIKKSNKKIIFLSKRELENFLITKEILFGYIKENHRDYFLSQGKTELLNFLKDILEESCEHLKKLALILNFLKILDDKLISLSIKIFLKYDSEKIWKLIKNKDINNLFPIEIKKIIAWDNYGNIFSNKFKTDFCKKIWESGKTSFDKYWEKWKLSEKLSVVPGKELIKVIREKIDIPNFQINPDSLIDFISKNKKFIPKEFERIIEEISNWNKV